MNDELKKYIRIEAIVAAAFNFFISGMIAALIHHMAADVPTDAVSIVIDLFITCLLTFTITVFFIRSSLISTNTIAILLPRNGLVRALTRLFRFPLLFGILLGLVSAVVLSVLIAPFFAFLNIDVLPFYLYVLFKSLSSMLLGGGVAAFELYVGFHSTE